MIDYHVHTTYSDDAVSNLRSMCIRAIEIGLEEIAFTEHLDFIPSDWSNEAFDYNFYMRDIESCRKEFGDKLKIRAGAEVDFQPQYRDEIAEMLKELEFDYVIGSAHFVGDIILEDHELYFPGKDLHEAYQPYFDMVLGAVETGLFDTLGHLDLCKRYGVMYYGPFQFDVFKPQLEKILRAVIDRGMIIEVNTSGLRQPPADTYPGIDTLKLYRELGGTVAAVGSDSHRTSDLASGIQTAISNLHAAGITKIARFENRKLLVDR